MWQEIWQMIITIWWNINIERLKMCFQRRRRFPRLFYTLSDQNPSCPTTIDTRFYLIHPFNINDGFRLNFSLIQLLQRLNFFQASSTFFTPYKRWRVSSKDLSLDVPTCSELNHLCCLIPVSDNWWDCWPSIEKGVGNKSMQLAYTNQSYLGGNPIDDCVAQFFHKL